MSRYALGQLLARVLAQGRKIVPEAMSQALASQTCLTSRRVPSMSSVDKQELRTKVRAVYREVARNPQAEFHFETGRILAERLGYPAGDLDRIPPEAIASFAGVGHHFDLAKIQEGESVLDLGSGSGTDAFVAALFVGRNGTVVGVDMTEEQLNNARTLGTRSGLANVAFRQGYIESLLIDDESVDVVISNGVINLSADKAQVFKEVTRVLKHGGRMAISDIVSTKELTEDIVCDASLWAACIGGAMQQDMYRQAIESAGMHVVSIRDNPQYHFLSESAQEATEEFGVKSISLVAEKR